MSRLSRRSFLQVAAAGGAGILLSGVHTPAHAKIRGANDAIRIAVAGLNSRGFFLAEKFASLPGVRLAALCDPDEEILQRQAVQLQERFGKPALYKDIRKLLEDKDIDALAIATPNHWHSLMAVWAVQAGKDVYVEKPVSHNIWEGRRLVEAARKHRRIVQAGLQSRSDAGVKQVFEYLWDGHLGKIKLARGFCYKRRDTIGRVDGPQPISAAVDYDLWSGPAPLTPLRRKSLHYDWHWVWETGNGDINNQGTHELDMCRWVLRQNKLPKTVMSFGGRFGYSDDGVTPNTQVAYFDYDTPMLFEVRGLPRSASDTTMDVYRGVRIGIVVECEDGYFAGGSGGGWIYDRNGQRIKQFVGDGGEGHYANFIEAVRNRNEKKLNAPILEGHLSTALGHMANISFRLGHSVSQDTLRQKWAEHECLADSVQRFQEHLSANGVELTSTEVVSGPTLAFNPKKERFKSDVSYDAGYWANHLVKDDYRTPYCFQENE